MTVNYCIVHPGRARGYCGSLGELRAFLETHGAAGFYDIVEGHAVRRLPGYTAPRWGIATKDRYGMVKLIPDFQRQIDDPS